MESNHFKNLCPLDPDFSISKTSISIFGFRCFLNFLKPLYSSRHSTSSSICLCQTYSNALSIFIHPLEHRRLSKLMWLKFIYSTILRPFLWPLIDHFLFDHLCGFVYVFILIEGYYILPSSIEFVLEFWKDTARYHHTMSQLQPCKLVFLYFLPITIRSYTSSAVSILLISLNIRLTVTFS